jgi:alpha-ketoglutarate-dependent taurine dioxygenase
MTSAPAPPSLGFRSVTKPTALITDLTSAGLALVEDVHDDPTLLTLARSLATVMPHRHGDPNGITVLCDRGPVAHRDGFAGFGTDALAVHTDRSGLPEPPGLVMTVCRQTAHHGGESLLVDGRAVYADMAEHHPDALTALAAPRSVLFGGAAGYLGAIITHRPDERVSLRLRWDSLARFCPDVARVLPVLRAVVDRHTTEIALRPGQGYVVDNHRWLHGRRAFTGPRAMSRVLGQPLPTLAMPTGFEPPSSPRLSAGVPGVGGRVRTPT